MSRFVLWVWIAWMGVGCVPTSASIIWSGEIDYRLSSSGMGDTMWATFDINRDSTWDFYFEGHDGFSFTPQNGSAGVASLDKYTPLDSGVLIDLDMPYVWVQDNRGLDWQGGGGILNPVNLLNKYLGVALEIDGATHYGWFQLSHYPAPLALPGQYQSSSTLIIHDFAWETEPDTPIVAGAVPEPASVVLALLGAITVWNLRRCQQRRLNDDGGK